VLADPKSPGCKKFTRTHPEYVQFQTLPSRGFYTDIDTPEAYETLRQSNQEANV
jgi:molybdenum cofactor cytidylyltransferase